MTYKALYASLKVAERKPDEYPPLWLDQIAVRMQEIETLFYRLKEMQGAT